MSVIFALLSPCSNEVLLQVVGSVLIAGHQVERVAVDLHVATDRHVAGSDPFVSVVDVLVPVALQELALDDARVLLGRLVDCNRVIGQVERDDEAAVYVLRNSGVEASRESQDLLVIVDALEEVALWLVRDQLVNIAEGVFLVADAVVRGNLDWHLLGWRWLSDAAKREVVAILLGVELLGELVDTLNYEFASVSHDVAGGGNLVAGQVVVSDEGLAWLVDIEAIWEFLSAEEQGEGVPSVVGVVDLTDFDGVIGQVVVDNKWKAIVLSEETQHLTVHVQELLLRGNLAATKALLKELLHLRVSLGRHLDLGLGKAVHWALLRWGERASLALK